MPEREALLPLARNRSSSIDSYGVRALTTAKPDGDLRIDGDPEVLVTRRRAVVDLPWVWLRQVHGADVVVVDDGNRASACGTEADALVTATRGVALAVHTADCSPVVFSDVEGSIIGVAHAGWRGLHAGVIEATVAAMRALGADGIFGVLGPCIRSECYEFGAADLDALVAAYGPSLRSETTAGTPALDMIAGVEHAARGCGIDLFVSSDGTCTSCDADRWFSHRARGETGRMATVVWIEP